MKNAFLVLMLAFGLALFPAVSKAAVLGNLVGGIANELEDDDFELLVNAGHTTASPGTGLGGDNIINVGDFLVAMFRITSLRVPVGGAQLFVYPDTAATFTGIVVSKVGSVTGPGVGAAPDGANDTFYQFIPATPAEWAAIGITQVPTAAAGTMVIFYDDPNNINQSAGSIPLSLATVSGTKLWEFGSAVLGAVPTAAVWNAASDTDNILTSFALGTTGSFSANLFMTALNGGVPLVPTPASPAPGAPLFDLLLRNGSFGAPATSSDFPISSDVDAILTPIPEPTSMLAWSALMLGLGAAKMRRRRKTS